MPIAEVEANYVARATGSVSKLDTYRDGWRILFFMLGLFKNERPVAFFGLAGAALSSSSVLLSIPVFITYFETGPVPRISNRNLVCSHDAPGVPEPRVCGLLLDTVTRGRRELKRLSYLQTPGPGTLVESEQPIP